MPDRAKAAVRREWHAAHNAQSPEQRAAEFAEKQVLQASEIGEVIAAADRDGQTVADLRTSLRSLTAVGNGW